MAGTAPSSGRRRPGPGAASPRARCAQDRWWLPPLRHVRRAHRLAALRPRSGPPRSSDYWVRRLPLPHAVRLALPVDLLRAGLEPLRHAVRRLPAADARSPILTLPFLLLFRLTCYYYRKAYYRSFWLSPPACAVAEPHATLHRRDPVPADPAERCTATSSTPPSLISLINTYDALRRLPRQGRRLRLRPRQPRSCWPTSLLLWAYTVSLPLLPQHHRRPAQPLLQAPGPLLDVGPGVAGSTGTTWVWPGSRSASLVVTDAYIALVAAGTISDLRFVD